MIDFHSHVLPKLDDGSKSTEESIEMLQLSKSHNIDTILATPHFYIKNNNIDRFIEKRSASFDALKSKLPTDNTVPNIILGAEVYFFNGISEIDNLDLLCIQNTKYMLLEMPFCAWSEKNLREVANIINSRSITPIIAHIERYIDYQPNFSIINELSQMDLYIQMNGEFVNGFFTKRKAISYLKSNLVQLIGSDCHNLSNRKPNLDKAYQTIEKKLGADALNKIDSLGRKILNI